MKKFLILIASLQFLVASNFQYKDGTEIKILKDLNINIGSYFCDIKNDCTFNKVEYELEGYKVELDKLKVTNLKQLDKVIKRVIDLAPNEIKREGLELKIDTKIFYKFSEAYQQKQKEKVKLKLEELLGVENKPLIYLFLDKITENESSRGEVVLDFDLYMSKGENSGSLLKIREVSTSGQSSKFGKSSLKMKNIEISSEVKLDHKFKITSNIGDFSVKIPLGLSLNELIVVLEDMLKSKELKENKEVNEILKKLPFNSLDTYKLWSSNFLSSPIIENNVEILKLALKENLKYEGKDKIIDNLVSSLKQCLTLKKDYLEIIIKDVNYSVEDIENKEKVKAELKKVIKNLKIEFKN